MWIIASLNMDYYLARIALMLAMETTVICCVFMVTMRIEKKTTHGYIIGV